MNRSQKLKHLKCGRPARNEAVAAAAAPHELSACLLANSASERVGPDESWKSARFGASYDCRQVARANAPVCLSVRLTTAAYTVCSFSCLRFQLHELGLWLSHCRRRRRRQTRDTASALQVEREWPVCLARVAQHK